MAEIHLQRQHTQPSKVQVEYEENTHQRGRKIESTLQPKGTKREMLDYDWFYA
jgi:hypothetical protein